ncbi:response regulator [Sphingomonas lenta]|uniref:DNA-binding response regulator n=1 Tax=Sphingomonas lenta TaxID=1141887 RepID=A0A2A2SHX5_9SPHN|nr:response regulator transcription factor [Sphingomonas lenta]PAX08846.1 DNA-binding response regulator [Sphingomonas lenta]
MSAARVVIADDHLLAREGLRALLQREPELDVVGEASSGEDAVLLCRELQPDLALLDLRFGSGIDGLEATRHITAERGDARVIILTLHDTAEYARAALEAGAMGFVTKDASREALLGAVGQVLAGGFAIPPELMRRAVARDARALTLAALDRLTPREREVLDRLAGGGTNKEIARELGISAGTVKVHLERLMSKLGVRDRTQAAVLASEAARLSRS